MTPPPSPAAVAPRPLPALTPETEWFWTAGADGVLRLQRCEGCDGLLHPSQDVCPDCPGAALEVVAVTGRGTVVGFTVNHQPWHPTFPVPYVIAVVALDDDPRVRLTTDLVGCDPDTVAVGLHVRVRFEPDDGVWLPLFEPIPGEIPGDAVAGAGAPGPPPAPALVPLPEVRVRPMARADKFEAKVALTGIGMSDVGRRLMRPALDLAVQSCRAAIADAGLTPADIDGVSTYPGGGLGLGMSEGGVPTLEEALRLQPTWFNGGMEVAGQGGAVIQAMLAVASGLCRHVLCVRTVWEATYSELVRSGRLHAGGGRRVGGDAQWRAPFGAMSAANWIGMNASQYLHRFDADRRMLGWIAVNARANAARNPTAIYRDPMTLDDHLSARMITTPFGLYDCDVPCDASVAIVVSAVDAAVDLRHRPVLVDAVGTQLTERQSWDQGTLTHEPNTFGPAAHLWSRTDLRPADVDVAELYDGFTFNCVSWLEALGFCGIGETQGFLDEGRTIALDGPLPLNTHGGQLSAGRLHGFGFLHEAVTQLRGDGADRQVAGAEVAVVSTGGGTPGGCFLLTRSR